jgi:S1-C subfamily serine protease
VPDVVVDVRRGGKLGVSSIVQVGPCELSGVQPGSAADKAGLRQGDVVVAVDGEPVASFEALTARVARHGPGETVRLAVQRDASGGAIERFDCEVRLDAW